MESVEKRCKYCLETFTTDVYNKLFCGEDCYKDFLADEYFKKHGRKKGEFGVANCAMCSVEFKKKRHNQIYCSVKCQKEYHFFNRSDYTCYGFDIFLRDKFRCVYCGRTSYEHRVVLNVEHIVPKSKGGSDEPTNLVTSCEKCNFQKGTKILPQSITESIQKLIKSRTIYPDSQ